MKKEQNPLKNSLSALGFSDKESSVYVALLGLGRSAVSKIARTANVNRATAYVILDSLIGKGLVHISGKEPKQEYEAESPDTLAALFRREREEAVERAREADALVPQLKSAQKVGDRPQVKFYEGIEGMKHVYEDTLTSTEEIRAYGNYDENYSTLKDYFHAYFKKRVAKGISVRAIAPRTTLSEERQRNDKNEGRELLLVPQEVFSVSPEIDAYDNKVVISSWREKLGIIIESAEIADAMKKIFELAWAEAKRQDATITGREGGGTV